MVEEKPKHHITVLRRTPITSTPRPGETRITLAITFIADDRPPRTIWMDKEAWTPEAEKAAIKAKIEELEKERAVEEYEL